MKMATRDVTIEKSYNPDEETQAFGIKDPAIFFDILCHKLYKDPARIVVQEYMCNARDAHRENGNSHEPILVTLPTIFSPTLKIQDFGVGISPERVKTVFVFLGESTKRLSNKETGGHGVGAKTAWAYTDSFTIKTIYEGIEYTYLAYIGDRRVGYMSLLSKKNTDDRNGTTIEVDIKQEDFSIIEKHVYRTSHFWEVKPIIKNSKTTLEFADITTQYNDEDGSIIGYYSKDVNSYNYLKEDSGKVLIVLDGIIYNSIYDYVQKNDVKNLTSRSNDCIYIRFETGEIESSINRTEIMNIPDFCEKIKNKTVKFRDIILSDFLSGVPTTNNVKDLLDYIDSVDIKTSLNILSSFKFNYNNVDIFYSNYDNKFSIEVGPDFVLQHYEFDGYTGFMKFELGHQKINLRLLYKKYCIYNDKFTKNINKNTIKWFIANNDDSKLKLDIYVLQPNFTTDKALRAVFIQNNANLLNFLKDFHKISELQKTQKPIAKVAVTTTPKNNIENFLPVRFMDYNKKKKWKDIFVLAKEFDYIIDITEDEYYNAYNMYEIIKQYAYLNKEQFIIAMVSKKVKDSLNGRLNKQIITEDQAYRIIYRSLLKQMTNNNYLRMSNRLFSINNFSEFEFIKNHASNIEDKKLTNVIQKIALFQSKIDAGSRTISRLFEKVLRRVKEPNAITKMSMIEKLLKRKNKLFNADMKQLVKEYPLVTSSYNYRNEDDMVKYINDTHFANKNRKRI